VIEQPRRKLTQARVEEWVAITQEAFTKEDACKEIGIESYQAREHLRIILDRLVDKNILRRAGKREYKRTDLNLVKMEWQKADPKNELNLTFPFGIEAVCRLFPKSIVVVAGSKNAGKTAWLLNFVVNNMNNSMGLHFFNSETGDEQLHERLQPFNIPSPAPFETWERYSDFAEVIQPDQINVIDYLDFNSDVYLVGEEIDQIFRRLGKGIAIIGLQKKKDQTLGYGGAFTAKRAQLYVTLDSNKMQLVYVKTPRGKTNPDNMAWTFKLEDGIHFTNVSRFYGFDNQ
jgi:hypothetical protein